MNLVAFRLILSCCNAWAAKTNFLSKSGQNRIIIEFLDKLKTALKTGHEKLGLPVLDPYNADQLEIKLNENMISLNALLKKVNVNGLSEFDIINTDLQISDQRFTLIFHLSWPLVTASTNYSINGKVDVFEIYGNNLWQHQMKMAAESFVFDALLDFSMKNGLNGHLKVKDIKLNLSLKSLDFHATGLYDNDVVSAVLSAMISYLAPKLVSDDTFINEIKQLISKLLDNFLSTKTVLELILLILSF